MCPKLKQCQLSLPMVPFNPAQLDCNAFRHYLSYIFVLRQTTLSV